MSVQSDSFTTPAEGSLLPDMQVSLRALAKEAQKAQNCADAYPRRTELMAILTDARTRIARINSLPA